MPKLAANLTMLFGEVPFLDRFEAGRRAPDSRASSICFPTTTLALVAEAEAARPRAHAGAAQPARPATGPPANAASPAFRIASTNSSRRRPGDRVRDRPRVRSRQLPRGNPSAGRQPGRRAGDVHEQPALRRAASGRGRHQAADRGDQHARPAGVLPQQHPSGRSTIIEAVGSDNLFVQYDIYHMQIMEGHLATTIEAHLPRDRAHAARRQSPGGTSREPVRSTTASCSTSSIALATTGGSAASTSRRRARSRDWGGRSGTRSVQLSASAAQLSRQPERADELDGRSG